MYYIASLKGTGKTTRRSQSTGVSCIYSFAGYTSTPARTFNIINFISARGNECDFNLVALEILKVDFFVNSCAAEKFGGTLIIQATFIAMSGVDIVVYMSRSQSSAWNVKRGKYFTSRRRIFNSKRIGFCDALKIIGKDVGTLLKARKCLPTGKSAFRVNFWTWLWTFVQTFICLKTEDFIILSCSGFSERIQF